LLVVEQACTSSFTAVSGFESHATVHGIQEEKDARKCSAEHVSQLLLPLLTAQWVTPAVLHTRSAFAVHGVDS